MSACSFSASARIRSVNSTDLLDFSRISSAIFLIVSALWLLCSASCLISVATTAKPLPACPALAASMEAFNDNRFVCAVISEISSTALLMDAMASLVAFTCTIISVIMSEEVCELSSTRFMDSEALRLARSILLEFSFNVTVSEWIALTLSPISNILELTVCTFSASDVAVAASSSTACLIWLVPLLLADANVFNNSMLLSNCAACPSTSVTILFNLSLMLTDARIRVVTSRITDFTSRLPDRLPLAIWSIYSAVVSNGFRILNDR